MRALLAPLRGLWRHRELILGLTRRELSSRYRGAMLAQWWPMLAPVLMLAVYTFVFGFVFRARWNVQAESAEPGAFAVILFAGLLVHGFMAEVLVQAPTLVVNQANFVKRVVFPLQALPLVSVLAAMCHAAIGFAILVLVAAASGSGLSLHSLWLPLVLAPLVFLVLGLSWFLAALGVYLRDVAQFMPFLVSFLLFMSPIFYPLSALPEPYRDWLQWNPLTLIVEQVRGVLLFAKAPEWLALGRYLAFSVVVAVFGYSFFQRVRRGFADVL